jgi:opacity protein-like surface antigen
LAGWANNLENTTEKLMIENKLRPHCVRVRNPLTLSLFFVLLFVVPESAAQQANVPARQQLSATGENRRNEFGIWGGISFDAPTWIGKTPDARFGNIGLRYGRVLAADDKLAFSWTIDAVPVAVLSVNRFTIVPTGSGSSTVQRTRDHTYGAGLSPIGLKLNFRRSQTLQPFVNGTAGFLYFSKDVPVPGAARFNFTFDFGGGVQIVRSSGRAITIGYKYQHISNGDRSPINPGVDVQMFYGGFSIFK